MDLFTAKSGPGIVSQLYAFEDKSERQLTRRPELTAPVMRMIAEEGMQMLQKPLRLSYYGQCYRYEESKKGRYREFYQYGAELIGAHGPLAEAEVVSLAIDMIDACGLEDYEDRNGNVGGIRDIVTGQGLSQEGEPEAPVASAMRLLDKGDWDESQGPALNHEFNTEWLRRCRDLLADHGTLWVSGTMHAIYSVGFAMQELEMKILNNITWQKPNPD